MGKHLAKDHHRGFIWFRKAKIQKSRRACKLLGIHVKINSALAELHARNGRSNAAYIWRERAAGYQHQLNLERKRLARLRATRGAW